MAYTKELYELCEKLGEELKRANNEVRMKDKLSGAELDWLDKLTHAMKSIKTVIAMEEENGYSERGSYAYGDRTGRVHWNDGNVSYGGDMSYGESYARGRNAKRDRMGRYSSERGYSRDDAKEDMMSELRGLMQDAPDERTKQEFRAFMTKLEQM